MGSVVGTGRWQGAIGVLRGTLAVLFGGATLFYVVLWMAAVRYQPAVELGYDSDYRPAEQAQLIRSVQPASPAERAGMRPGDLLVAIDGQPLSDANYQPRAWDAYAPGDTVRLTLRRAGESSAREVVGTFRVRRSAVSSNGFGGYVAGQILAIYPVPFVLVGLAVLFLRIGDPRAWLLALVFAGFASTPAFPDSLATFAPALQPFARLYQGMLIALFAPLFNVFFSTFPARSSLDRRIPWLKWLGLAAGALMVAPSTQTGALRLPAALQRTLGDDLSNQVAVWWLLAMLTLGLVSLTLNFFNAPDEQARRKSRVIFAGTAVGLVPNLLIVGTSSLLGYREPVWLAALRAVFAFLVPLGLAYAVVKHRVLDIPVLLRRGARYLLVQRGFTVLVALFSIVATVALSRWLAPALAFNQSAAIVVGAALGMLLLWSGSLVHRRVSERIDRAFFRQAYDARGVLQDLANRATRVSDRAELAAMLRQHLADALQPVNSAVYLSDESARLRLMAGNWPSAPAALAPDSRWLAPSATRWAPANPVERSDSSDPDTDLECAVPLLGRDGHTLGVLVLGPRRSEEPYSREDLELLAVVARQAALALENLVLAEQMVARMETERRHAHELSIARDVQQMLLPQRTPPLVTLDYEGTCSQARVVGGDYYDYLDLGPGRVGFVLADIAGKGIAASLLMANLQAIIRSHSSLAATDHEAVLRAVNQLFRDSTTSNRFATLFFGSYDDATRTLAYVNCGHNPPILLRADGTAEWLPPTAIALGFAGNWTCATVSHRLGPGDVLVMYSDGITEAWSDADEDYGDTRLLDVVRSSRELPAHALVGHILADVRRFSRPEQSDDWTLIVAKGRE